MSRSRKDSTDMRFSAFLSVQLKDSLKSEGRTQCWVANQTNISKQMMSYYIAGRSLPSIHIAYRIFRLLNIDMNTFMQRWEAYNDNAVK